MCTVKQLQTKWTKQSVSFFFFDFGPMPSCWLDTPQECLRNSCQWWQQYTSPLPTDFCTSKFPKVTHPVLPVPGQRNFRNFPFSPFPPRPFFLGPLSPATLPSPIAPQ